MAYLTSTRLLAATVLATLSLGAASVAQARSDVSFSIGLQVPGYYDYAEPAPVYVRPQPVYVQPRPLYAPPRQVYVQPPAYYGQSEVYLRRGPPSYDYRYDKDRYDEDRYDEDRYDWREQRRRRHWKHHHQDRD